MTEENTAVDNAVVEGADVVDTEGNLLQVDMALEPNAEKSNVPEPQFYRISVEREEQTVEYSPVTAFQVQGPLLMMDINRNTTLVPIVGDGVLSVDIVPVYVEGV
jgi:hypothetical protein